MATQIATLLAITIIGSLNTVYSGPTSSLPIRHNYIELSYPINNETFHWVTMRDVSYQILNDGEKPRPNNTGSYYLKNDRLEIDLHSGTHLDAPVHFGKGKWSVDQIPLDRLLGVPTFVVDVSAKCQANRKYVITRQDLLDYERDQHLTIPAQSLVLFYTGFSELWSKGKEEYFGTSGKDLTQLSIPSISGDAASFLVHDRQVVGVGLDAPSADGSAHVDAAGQMNPLAHEIINGANVYIIENINQNLKRLLINQTETGTIIRCCSLPLPISTASGSPIRLIAELLPASPEMSAHQMRSYVADAATSNMIGAPICLCLQLIVTIAIMLAGFRACEASLS